MTTRGSSGSARTLPISVAGEPCLVDSRRALFWHGAGVLVLADVFLGNGEAVPSGHTAADIAQIDDLLTDYRPQRMVVCGDLFHACFDGEAPWLDDLRALRGKHERIAFDVVLGNHDRRTAALPDLDITWHRQLALPPLAFAREPQEQDGVYTLCGELHPVTRLRGAGDALRLPVLWLRARHGVLPAFGSFSGGHEVRPAPGEQAFALSPQAVIAVPSS